MPQRRYRDVGGIARRMPFDREDAVRRELLHRQRGREPGRLHTGQRTYPLENAIHEYDLLRLLRIGAGGQRHLHRQQVLWEEAQIHPAETIDALCQKRAAKRQGHGDCDLDDSQRVEPPAAGRSPVGTALTLPQGHDRIAQVRKSQRRQHREDEAAQHGDDQAEHEHAGVQPEICDHDSKGLGLNRRAILKDRPHEPGQHESGRAAGERQHRAFREQLLRDAPGGRAEPDPNRQFTLPNDASNEQQAGDVDATHDQQKDNGQQHDNDRPRHPAIVVADRPLPHGEQPVAPPALRLRKPAPHLERRLTDDAAGLAEGDTIPQSRNEDVPMDGSKSHGRRLRGNLQRCPDLRARGIVEAVRHDADDRVTPIVQIERLADDLRIPSEAPLPQCVAKQHGWRPTRFGFVL
jgi:hypothetical protein